MPIVVSCTCGQRFAAKDELAGRTVKCPKCGASLQIAAAGAPAKTPATAAPKPAPAAASGVGDILDEIGLTGGSSQGSPCPKCNEGIIRPGTVICTRCGYNIQTGAMPKPKEEKPAHAQTAKYDWSKIRDNQGGDITVAPDEDITAGEIFLCLFCGCIAWVYGIVLFCQGRPKGLTIIMLSMILPLVGAVVRLLVGVMLTAPATTDDDKKDSPLNWRPLPPAITRSYETV